MTVEASLSHQEEDIVYYDAKADAELVSAPTLAGGRGGASKATPPSSETCSLSWQKSVRTQHSESGLAGLWSHSPCRAALTAETLTILAGARACR